jgi:hypothetical protein
LHGTPQPPQLVNVDKLASQPLFGLLSQLAKPMAHEGEQPAAAQDVVPLGFVHAVPHVRQLVSVLSGVSQPLAATTSQSPKFVLQDVSAQVPVWHVPTPLAYEHTLPHIPQFDVEVLVFVSQPLFGLVSQLAKPIAHIGVHMLLEQAVVPFAFVHVVPQDPQFEAFVAVLLSHPFPYMPSQFWNGVVQDWITHVVPLHVGVPFCTEHTLPQPPHALTLFVVAASQPLLTFASQLPKPAAHMIPHAPLVHVAEPFVELQTFMHAPQFEVFVAVLISQPFVLTLSQLANVPTHEVISHVPVAHDVLAFG